MTMTLHEASVILKGSIVVSRNLKQSTITEKEYLKGRLLVLEKPHPCAVLRCEEEASLKSEEGVFLCAEHAEMAARIRREHLERTIRARYNDATECYRSHLEWSRLYGKKHKRTRCPIKQRRPTEWD
jgi:hypothetical protein